MFSRSICQHNAMEKRKISANGNFLHQLINAFKYYRKHEFNNVIWLVGGVLRGFRHNLAPSKRKLPFELKTDLLPVKLYIPARCLTHQSWDVRRHGFEVVLAMRKRARVRRQRCEGRKSRVREDRDSKPPPPTSHLPPHPLQQSTDSVSICDRLCHYKTMNVTVNIVTSQNHSLLRMTPGQLK